jgi:hypothetical protein
VAAGGIHSKVTLWSAATGGPLGQFDLGLAWAEAIAFSPDGTALAVGSEDNVISLWSVADRKEVRRFSMNDPEVHSFQSVAFSPDGRLLASGDTENEVRLWEVATGREVCCFRGHSEEVLAVAFSPAGRTLASASRDTTILVWDVVGLTPGAGRPAKPLSAARLERLWEALNGRDGRAAFRAVGELVHAEAASFLAGRLRPAVGVAPERIAAWVAALDSNDFAAREKASAELARAGEQAVQALREGRALLALELMGTPAARQVLRSLAAGAPGAWLTEQAHAALRRLEKCPGPEKGPPAAPGNPAPSANGAVTRPGRP